MAPRILDNAVQYERDLRSTSQDKKREKTSNAKWSAGVRPPYGVRHEDFEATAAQMRPMKKASKPTVPTRPHPASQPNGRGRGKDGAKEELEEAGSRSLLDLLVPTGGIARDQPGVLYSFDTADTPGLRAPLSLDVYVTTSNKTTEKLITQEYEVVDHNGDALRGRRARNNLRQSASTGAPEALMAEEDGYDVISRTEVPS